MHLAHTLQSKHHINGLTLHLSVTSCALQQTYARWYLQLPTITS